MLPRSPVWSHPPRSVSALAAGYERHYLADLPAGASSEHRGEVRAEAVKDCVVEVGMARVTGINAASNLVRFADELTADQHPPAPVEKLLQPLLVRKPRRGLMLTLNGTRHRTRTSL